MSYAEPITTAEAHYIVRQLMSSLAWAQNRRLREAFSFGGGFPFHAGKGKTDLGVEPLFEPVFQP